MHQFTAPNAWKARHAGGRDRARFNNNILAPILTSIEFLKEDVRAIQEPSTTLATLEICAKRGADLSSRCSPSPAGSRGSA